jgi:hypothetical protein
MNADLFASLYSGAAFSPCRKYRYRLWRTWGDPQKRVAFIGLNPSTADESKDDPTIRKCIGFAKRWGYGGLTMLNLFGWRSTDPKGLREPADPVGLDNDTAIGFACIDAERVVFAWGSHQPVRELLAKRAADLREKYDKVFRSRAVVLGRCADGNPRHPLMLPYTTPVEAP